MRAQIAARLMPSCCESSVPDTEPSSAPRKAERICASVVKIKKHSTFNIQHRTFNGCPPTFLRRWVLNVECFVSFLKIQSDVHRPRRVRERADGNEVPARIGNRAHTPKIHTAAGFGLRTASDFLHREP